MSLKYTIGRGVCLALSREKKERLVKVAQMYYLQDRKQSDIAKEFNVSRPFVSKMLQEARNLGLVEIKIHNPDEELGQILRKFKMQFGIVDALFVKDGKNDVATNKKLSEMTLQYLQSLQAKHLGVGWAHFIGSIVDYLMKSQSIENSIESVFPLVGDASVFARNYQSSENVRIIADKLNAQPHFLHLPALPNDCTEKEILCSTNSYHNMLNNWENMDTALVNIGNYPSTPDFASAARYGNILQEKKVSGRFVAYFYTEQGEILSSENDFAIQIPLEYLKKCKNVIGICSATISPKAVKGALKTKLFTHIVCSEKVAQACLRQNNSK